MGELVRVLLLILLAGAALTAAGLFASWWMEDARRLRRALRRALGSAPDSAAIAAGAGRAAGLDFASESLAVLWDRGAAGLVYAFDEVEGAELIVDGRVSARVRRHEPRRDLEELPPDAEAVTLRLVFADPRWPEFELDLFGPGDGGAADPADAMRLGRRWLAHLEAVLRRPPRPPAVAVGAAELEDQDALPWDDDDEPELAADAGRPPGRRS